MSDLPKSIWADPPDIFDDMSIWYNYPTEGQTEYVRADTVQAQIDAAVKAEREWWITSLAPIRHQAASTRGEQAYRELPSFVVNVLTALIRKGEEPSHD